MKKIAAAVFLLCLGAVALAQKDNSDLKSDKKQDSSIWRWKNGVQYVHPDLNSGTRKVQHIVLIPPLALIWKESSIIWTTWNLDADDSNTTARSLGPLVADSFRNLNCSVSDISPEFFTDNHNEALGLAVVKLSEQFDTILADMSKRPKKKVSNGGFTMGPPASTLPNVVDFDALVFVRARGRVMTRSVKTLNIMSGKPVLDELDMVIAVVDAKTGDLLYYVSPTVHENLTKNTEKTRAAIEKSLKTFPMASPLKAPSATPPQSADLAAITVSENKIEDLDFLIEPGWSKAYSANGPIHSNIVEYVREGDDINNWKELVTIQQFRRSKGDISPEQFLKVTQSERDKECPASTVWNVIDKSETSILYEWQAKPCLGWPEQHEIARIIYGQQFFFVLHYVAKVNRLPEETRSKWIKKFSETTVRQQR